MNRADFEVLRDLPNKRISQDVEFKQRQQLRPNMVAEDLEVENSQGVDLRLTIHFNPERGSKTFNVHCPGLGPICRLDVDGPPHRPAGGSHKHSLQGPHDPNLSQGVLDRPELAGRTLKALFEEFCKMANIQFTGTFVAPDEEAP